MLVHLVYGSALAALAYAHAQNPLQWSQQEQEKPAARNILTPEFNTWIEEFMQNNNVRGHSVTIVRTKGSVFEEFGAWGNRTEDGDAMTPNTLFTLASVSKAFLATSVGILMEDFAHGRNVTSLPDSVQEFTWKSKLQDLLPEDWKLMDEWASEKANVHDLLSHVSGLPRHEFSYGPQDSPKDVIRRMRYLRPSYELREKWHYNNQPYMLFAHLIERYSGMPFTTFISDRIFLPLKMRSTTYLPSIASATGRFTQTFLSNGRRIPNWFTDELVGLNAGPGGVISSTVDLARWVRFLLDDGANSAYNATGIPRSVVDECMRVHVIMPRDKPSKYFSGTATYGMAWFQDLYRGHRIIYHTGSIPGIATLVAMFPDDDLGFILLTNTDNRAQFNLEVMSKMADAAFGLKSVDHDLAKNKIANSTSPSVHVEYTTGHKMLPIDSFAGVYADPGYGAFELCAPHSISPQCLRTLRDFAAVPNASRAGAGSRDALYATWPRIWSSHLRLDRRDNTTFGVGPVALFPRGYGNNASAFEMGAEEDEMGVRAEFEFGADGRVVGLGLLGLVGEVTERERIGLTVEERAEVWFRRVGVEGKH